nr:ABC transporter transmembrane domain-containing protein [Marinicella sp. W31]MDC2877958.1 ABC transporter transmembrane domain-containing protein [Marinicella sp. W31]
MSRNAKTSGGRAKELRPLTAILPYITAYRGFVAGALTFLLIASLVTLALPVAVRRVIDHGFSSDDAQLINNYFLVLGLMALALGISSALRYFFVMILGERVVTDLRRDVFAHVIRLSPAFFDINQSGEIVSRLTADTVQIKSAFGASASIALRNLIMGTGALAMMIYTSPRLSVLVIAAIPLVVLPLIAAGRKVRSRSRTAQDQLAGATAFAGEAIGATRTLQAFTAEDMASNRYSHGVEGAFSAVRLTLKARATLTAVAISMVFCSITAILWFGAQSVLAGTMSGGTLGQFLLYSVLAAGALGQLSEVWGELSLAAGAAERLTELLVEPSAIKAPDNPVTLPAPSRGGLEADKVSFRYPTGGAKAGALNRLSLAVSPGETVAVVGPSGAGKSTLFSLLLRFYDPDEGEVRLDGVDLRKAAPEAVRSRFCAGATGCRHLCRQHPRQYRARPTRRDARSGSRSSDRRSGRRLHRKARERLRYDGRRARHHLVRRSAPEDRDCPCRAARCTGSAAGRGNIGTRCGKRDTGSGCTRRADERPHNTRDRP